MSDLSFQFFAATAGGINLGLSYGQTVSRTIELRNDGEFAFCYKVFDVAAESERLDAEAKGRNKMKMGQPTKPH